MPSPPGSGFAICKISRLEDRTLLKHRGNERSLLEPQSCPRWPSGQQAAALFLEGSWWSESAAWRSTCKYLTTGLMVQDILHLWILGCEQASDVFHLTLFSVAVINCISCYWMSLNKRQGVVMTGLLRQWQPIRKQNWNVLSFKLCLRVMSRWDRWAS